VVKNARTLPATPRAAGGWVFLITHLTGTSRLGLVPQEKKSFDVLVLLRWAMKNALVAAPPFG
jgi:hypothetical protein